MRDGIAQWLASRRVLWVMATLLAACGWMAVCQPVAGLHRSEQPRDRAMVVPGTLTGSEATSPATWFALVMVAGEFVPPPTAGLPDPMCTRPSGQRQCVVSSVASNATGDVFATFSTGTFSPGDLGLYRLAAGADQWERLAVVDPALQMEGPAPVVPAVAVSADGSVFALGFWPGRAVDGAVLRSLDDGLTWQMYARAAAGTSLIAVDQTDTLWVGSADGLLRSLHPASLQAPPDDHETMLARVRSDCFGAGARAGQLVEFPDGSFQCRFPDGGLILCPSDLQCTISGPSGVTGPYPAPGWRE